MCRGKLNARVVERVLLQLGRSRMVRDSGWFVRQTGFRLLRVGVNQGFGFRQLPDRPDR